jgi:hypothetical protein
MRRDTAGGLEERIATLEIREAARDALVRYMELCDVPQPAFSWEDMSSLFTEDAVWEGIGPEYTGKFGRLEGRPAVLSMLADFLPPSSHFKRNIHLLGGGSVVAVGSAASGTWIMQQLSEYDGGGTELISARLTVDFQYADGAARISHFRTEKLVSAHLANPIHA